MKPTQEQILSALNKLIRENKTELKSEKIELGAVDDLNKFGRQFNSALNEIREAGDAANAVRCMRRHLDLAKYAIVKSNFE